MLEKGWLVGLDSLLKKKRLVVSVGSGGVGKTTTAAAIALFAALSGKRALVLTIDPAKRLAQSLGMEGLGNEIKDVEAHKLNLSDTQTEGGLSAAMLDTKASLDNLIRRITKDETQAKRILENNIYRQMSNALAGSQEYAAMERLYEVMQTQDFETVVLDTPPTKNAIDFLNAPNRLASFLDEGVVKWFVKPAGKGLGSRLFQKGGSVVFKLLGLLLGEVIIHDLTDFFQAFSGLYGGFKERAERVHALLRDEKTVFVLVTSAEKNALAEAVYFHDKLMEAAIPLETIIVNRAFYQVDATTCEPVLAAQLQERLPDQEEAKKLAGKLTSVIEHARRFNQLSEANIKRFLDKVGHEKHVEQIPIFFEEIYDIQGLSKMNDYLFER